MECRKHVFPALDGEQRNVERKHVNMIYRPVRPVSELGPSGPTVIHSLGG